jgi:hypothetical protein
MATSISAFKIPARQVPAKRPLSDAERARNYRLRKKAEAAAPLSAEFLIPADHVEPAPCSITATEYIPDTVRIEPAPNPNSRPPIASVVLVAAAIGLAGVGITVNAWFARSLGSTDAAGFLFLAIGIASDLAALVLPAVCARAWQAGHRGAALAGWSVWIVAFCFAVTASVGFTALNVTDTTMMRASRVTPAIVTARDGLVDAVTARDRECRTGTGRFCREREADVANRRSILDTAMHDVRATADPQAEAATRLVAWVSAGTLRPSGDDFALLRLALLTLLPQCAGLLLLVARAV